MNTHIIKGLQDIHKLRTDGYGDDDDFVVLESGEVVSIPDMLFFYDGQAFTVVSEN